DVMLESMKSHDKLLQASKSAPIQNRTMVWAVSWFQLL
ncbi:hypothetical protein CISIN_1g0393871mg, partial [Citrus sinensis]